MVKIDNIETNASGMLFFYPELVFLDYDEEPFWGAEESYRFITFTSSHYLLQLLKKAIETEQYIIVLDTGFEQDFKYQLSELTSNIIFIPYISDSEKTNAKRQLLKHSSAKFFTSACLNDQTCINLCHSLFSSDYIQGLEKHIYFLSEQVNSKDRIKSKCDDFLKLKKINTSDFNLLIQSASEKSYLLSSHSHNRPNEIIPFEGLIYEKSSEHRVLQRISSNECELVKEVCYFIDIAKGPSRGNLSHLERLINLAFSKTKNMDNSSTKEAYLVFTYRLIQEAIEYSFALNKKSNAYYLHAKALDLITYYIKYCGHSELLIHNIINHYFSITQLSLYIDAINFTTKQCGHYIQPLNKAINLTTNSLDRFHLLLMRASVYSRFKHFIFADIDLKIAKEVTISSGFKVQASYYLALALIAINSQNKNQFFDEIAQVPNFDIPRAQLTKLGEEVYSKFNELSFDYFNKLYNEAYKNMGFSIQFSLIGWHSADLPYVANDLNKAVIFTYSIPDLSISISLEKFEEQLILKVENSKRVCCRLKLLNRDHVIEISPCYQIKKRMVASSRFQKYIEVTSQHEYGLFLLNDPTLYNFNNLQIMYKDMINE